MPPKQKKNATDWEIFHVRYQNPKFGSDGAEFLPDVHTFIVATKGGPGDARTACGEYHPGSRVLVVMDPKCAALDDADGSLTRKAIEDLERKKKK